MGPGSPWSAARRGFGSAWKAFVEWIDAAGSSVAAMAGARMARGRMRRLSWSVGAAGVSVFVAMVSALCVLMAPLLAARCVLWGLKYGLEKAARKLDWRVLGALADGAHWACDAFDAGGDVTIDVLGVVFGWPFALASWAVEAAGRAWALEPGIAPTSWLSCLLGLNPLLACDPPDAQAVFDQARARGLGRIERLFKGFREPRFASMIDQPVGVLWMMDHECWPWKSARQVALDALAGGADEEELSWMGWAASCAESVDIAVAAGSSGEAPRREPSKRL